MTVFHLLDATLHQRLVITLGHSLWQGALLASVALAVSAVLQKRSSAARYITYVSALLLLAFGVPVTFALVQPPAVSGTHVTDGSEPHRSGRAAVSDLGERDGNAGGSRGASRSAVEVAATVNADTASRGNGLPSEVPAGVPIVSSEESSGEALRRLGWWLPAARWLSVVYSLGVLAMLLRVAVSLHGAQRLRKLSVPTDDARILTAVARQAQLLGLRLAPPIAYCRKVTVPTVVGVVRPVILLPLSLATALTIDEIETLLAHELAHIRRWDPWVNLLQRIIESLLFFNPAVWVLSRCVSAERENCCDDLVVRVGAEPARYALSLVRLAELSRGGAVPLPAATLLQATGGHSQLSRRVQRLLGVPSSTRMSATLGRKGALCLVVTVGLLGLAALIPQPTSKSVAVAQTPDHKPVIDASAAPHEVVEKWIHRVKDPELGKSPVENQRTWDLTTRSGGIDGHLELSQLWAGDTLRVARTLRNDAAAMVFTNEFRDNSGRQRVMRFYLEHANDRWLINRSGFVSAAEVPQLIEGFGAHPGVKFHYLVKDLVGQWLGTTQCASSICPQVLQLKSDGTFSQRFTRGSHVGGAWSINADSLVIQVQAGPSRGLAQSTPPIQITQLTNDELKVEFTLQVSDTDAARSNRRPVRYWYRKLRDDQTPLSLETDQDSIAKLTDRARQLIGTWTRSSFLAVWAETFLPDGTYIHTSNFDAPSVGSWILDGHKLHIQAEPGVRPGEENIETTRMIIEVNDSEIIFEYLDDTFGAPPILGANRFRYTRVKEGNEADEVEAESNSAQDRAAKVPWDNVKWSGDYSVVVPIDAAREQYFTLGDGRVYNQLPADPPTWSIVRDPKLADPAGSDLVLRFHGIHTTGVEREDGIRLWENSIAAEHARIAAGFFGELPFERHGLYIIRRDALPLTIHLTYYGLLQVTEVIDDEGPRVKVRYKLLDTGPENARPIAAPSSTGLPALPYRHSGWGTRLARTGSSRLDRTGTCPAA